MVSRWSLTLALVVLLVVPASAADQSVTATPGNDFSPAAVTIDLGDTVTWSNGGGFHNVKFDDGSFEQPSQPDFTSWSVQRTFDAPGTFRYYCEQHGGPDGAGMAGTVEVRDATGEVPPPADVPPGLSIRVRDQQGLGRLEKNGVRVRTRCANGCDVTLRLSLAPRTAARFGFARRRKTIGRETDSLPIDQRVPIHVDLTRRAEAKLEDAKRPFKIRIDVRARQDTTETARRTIKITP